MYFMDFVVNSLVSCVAIIEGGFLGFVIKSCRHGMAVLSEEAFYVIAYDFWFVIGSGSFGGGGFCVGGG